MSSVLFKTPDLFALTADDKLFIFTKRPPDAEESRSSLPLFLYRSMEPAPITPGHPRRRPWACVRARRPFDPFASYKNPAFVFRSPAIPAAAGSTRQICRLWLSFCSFFTSFLFFFLPAADGAQTEEALPQDCVTIYIPLAVLVHIAQQQ